MNDVYLLAQNFLALFIESAPWLLLGLLVAAIMHELVPVSLLQRHMGSNSVGAVTKAAVIGAPLPLCSCGVIPAAVGLRRSGASKPATVSFLVSTPETGVDSISVSYALLGPLYAIVRPVAAISSAIYAGLMVKFFGGPDDTATVTPADKAASSGCCSSEKNTPSAASESSNAQAQCCDTDAPATSCGSNHPTIKQSKTSDKLRSMWQFSTGQLLSDITVWLLFGLALAAAIQTWVPTDFLTRWGDGLVAMLLMAVIGVPMYICATASTPLAVGFLAAGLSPGAVLVFLLAGPATNVSTMGMMLKELGRRSLALYLFSVLTASIGLGYLLNWAVAAFAWQDLIVTAGAMHEHGQGTQMLYALCAIVLGLLMLKTIWQMVSEKLRTSPSESSCCH
ncbi:SO_0444 family Cu/Zn efflux transporter [Salinimonas chungwhensis]|uniref:SO_0444 family Cu/Zn efflux transporter n=1 Tax=Salinimonas chungwhensis TaxID=265425 RepID=UPI000372E8C9|nr:SO_0444 family Cu/Zn efflux transporter [Salinimonas chungwhensis]